MSLDDKVNQIDKAKEPAPADDEEEHEHNDAYRVLFCERNAQPYEALHYPTDEGNEQQQYLNESFLFVKPFIKRHYFTPLIFDRYYTYAAKRNFMKVKSPNFTSGFY